VKWAGLIVILDTATRYVYVVLVVVIVLVDINLLDLYSYTVHYRDLSDVY
jgi:hypothetical protein